MSGIEGPGVTGGTFTGLLRFSLAGTVTAAAGAQNNVAPDGGVNVQTLDRLYVNTAAGNASFTGLAAGLDGQLLWIVNTGANDLTLQSENAGSTITNRFKGVADLTVPGGDSLLIYYDSSIGAVTPGRWVMGV